MEATERLALPKPALVLLDLRSPAELRHPTTLRLLTQFQPAPVLVPETWSADMQRRLAPLPGLHVPKPPTTTQLQQAVAQCLPLTSYPV